MVIHTSKLQSLKSIIIFEILVFTLVVSPALVGQAQPQEVTSDRASTALASEQAEREASEENVDVVHVILYPHFEEATLSVESQISSQWSLLFRIVKNSLEEEERKEAQTTFSSWQERQTSWIKLKNLGQDHDLLKELVMDIHRVEELDLSSLTQLTSVGEAHQRLTQLKKRLHAEEEWRDLQNRLATQLDLVKELLVVERDLARSLHTWGPLLKSELLKLDEELELLSPQAEEAIPDVEEEEGHRYELIDELIEELKVQRQVSQATVKRQRELAESAQQRALDLERLTKSLTLLTKDSERFLSELDILQSHNESALRITNRLGRYFGERERVTRERSEASRENLLSLSSTQRDKNDEWWRGIQELDAELKERVTRFESDHREPLKAMQPPAELTEVEDPAQVTQLHRVQKALKNAHHFFTFHQSRLSRLNQATVSMSELKSKVEELLQRLAMWEGMIEYDVLQELLQKQGMSGFLTVEKLLEYAEVRPSELRVQELLSLIGRWELVDEDLSIQTEDWAGLTQEDEQAVTRLNHEINSEGGLADRMRMEEAWVGFMNEIDSLEGPELLVKHSEALATFIDQEQKMGTLKKEYESLVQEFNQRLEDLEQLSDPITRQYQSTPEQFEQFKEQMTSLLLAQDQFTLPPIILEVREDPAHASIREEGAEEGEVQSGVGHVQQLQRLRLERVLSFARMFRNLLPPRVTHYRQVEMIKNQLQEQLTRRKHALMTFQAELTRRIDLARQVRRTASAIRRRVIEGSLSPDAMNQDVEMYGQRAWVDRLRAETLDREENALSIDQNRVEELPPFEKLIQILEGWRKQLTEVVDLAEKQLLGLDVLFKVSSGLKQTTDTSLSDPADLEREFEHRVRLRMELDLPWYEPFWRSFQDEHLQGIDALLKERYVQLLLIEERQSAFEEQINLTTNLVQLVSGQLPILKDYYEHLIVVTNAVKNDLDQARLLWLLRSDTQRLVEQGGSEEISLTVRVLLQQRGSFRSIEERDLALEEIEGRWALYNGYLKAKQELNTWLSPRGALEQISGDVLDAVSQLKLERDELNRPLIQLLGWRARGTQRADKKIDLGEIDRLHMERRKLKFQLVIWSLLSFLLIPIIALLSLKLLNRAERRIKLRTQQEMDRLIASGAMISKQKREEREDRLTTLLQVGRTTAQILISIVAGGAILKTLNVDVTPIIASAGIIGLAFAFGAQELVKDFFAGVFILFENQYNRGDFVTINGIFGVIDRITLRLTVVRDSNGVVHFIPNGHVQLVSNHNKDWSQAHIELGVSYNNKPDHVIKTLRRVCDEVATDHIIGEDVLGWEVLGLERFDDSAVVYRVHLKTTPKEQWRVARHFRRRVMEIFAVEGIEIPFPQVVVNLPDSSISENARSEIQPEKS